MWFYSQSTGELFNQDGHAVGRGYAGGDCGAAPWAINNPRAQTVHNVGPLPRGVYEIGAPVEHTRLGPYALPLVPHPTNQMYGRSGFFMHADTAVAGQASDGCIVMPDQVRHLVWDSQDHLLVVLSAWLE